MAYFDDKNRWGNNPVNRPDSSGSSDLEPTDTRNVDRRGDDESYDSWLERQTANGWPEWFVRWAFPREQFDNSDEWKGFKNVASFMATMFGLGAGGSALMKGGSLLAAKDLLSSKQSAQQGNPSSFMNFLSNLGGNGSNIGSGLFDSLLGFGSQYTSSLLNYQNMEKLIDKQNAYNTPANQMQRFAEAGLNPNLVYGLGNNGNQPASGSIAPVDFDTSQREARLARMSIDTQTKMANADVADKMASVKVKDTQAELLSSQHQEQQMRNSIYMQQQYAEYMNKVASYRETMNRINNDNIRVQFEQAVADAQRDLYRWQAQPQNVKNFDGWLQIMEHFDKRVDELIKKFPTVEVKGSDGKVRRVATNEVFLAPESTGAGVYIAP